MQVYPNRFAASLAEGLKPVYLIFGDEPQQKQEILDGIRSQAQQQGFDERTVLCAEGDFRWGQLVEATQAMSLFSAAQLIELELPTGKPGTEGSKTLIEVAGNLSPDTLLVIHGPRIGKDVQRTKWFKALDNLGVHSIVYPLEGQQLITWIKQKLQANQLSVDSLAVKLIADFCEGNLLAAKQEIDKLALLHPDGGALSAQEVEQAIVDQSRYTAFQLIDTMLSGDSTKTVKILMRLESEGLEPNIVLWAMIREWQTLWKLRSKLDKGEMVEWQKLGIWKNRQPLYQSALSRLDKSQLASLRDTLSQADSVFKQESVIRPFVKLCHLCMMFLGMPVSNLAAFD